MYEGMQPRGGLVDWGLEKLNPGVAALLKRVGKVEETHDITVEAGSTIVDLGDTIIITKGKA